MILFLDDLHWADGATLGLLNFLFHRLHTQRIWFLGTYDPEEIAPGHPLSRFQAWLLRRGLLAQHDLARLNGEAIFTIVRTFPGLDADQVRQLTLYLQRASEGNPFRLNHLARHLENQDVLRRDGYGWHLDSTALVACHRRGIGVAGAAEDE